MNDVRRYQRYAINYDGDTDTSDGDTNTTTEIEVIVEGELARLVDFSLGGLSILSKKPFSLEAIISVSVNLEDRGKIALIGKVVRVREEGDMWGIAIDLSHTYKLDTIRKI